MTRRLSFPLCRASAVNLDVCLDKGGQSFTWIRTSQDTWINSICGKPVVIERVAGKITFSLEDEKDEAEVRRALEDYFRLGHDLDADYAAWSSDKHFAELATAYPAICCLRQDPVETLFAFICSQNNAIGRITRMVQHLKTAYGEHLGAVGDVQVHGFPALHRLAGAHVEAELRAAGFGYRAKYIQQAARHLLDSKVDLLQLRAAPYDAVQEVLLQVPGVGPKVADCIALMALDQLGAVPVDTHIWRLAAEKYRFSGMPKTKATMNRAVYKAIGEHFRGIFGERAGWAHLVLFAAQSRKPRGAKPRA